jgi:hypothetical protein
MSGGCNDVASLAGHMKNLILNRRSLRVIGLGLTLGFTPFVGGCLQESAIPSAQATVSVPKTSDNLEPFVTPTSETVTLDQPEEDAALLNAPAKPVSTEKPLPPGIKPTESLSSLLRLVQSGLGESVLLAFVTNAAGSFSLGSEEIIYLSDIGVPGNVVSAMLQHDHLLVQNAEAVLAAQPIPAVEPEPTTPVLPPEPEPQPETETIIPTPDYAAEAPLVPEEIPSDAIFYDALAPYGTWVNVEGPGMCWQPSVGAFNPGWRPYCDRGRWVYSDCGWYWSSDYSWGWAPFHYGRWFRHNSLGWCWTPDKVWGPSWVSWRYSNDYCGWAPLPPVAHFRPGLGFDYHGHSVGFSFNYGLSASCYTFVPTKNFCDSRVSRHVVPHSRVKAFYNDTVAVNRIVGDHKRISNYGIPAERITAATRTRLRPVAVREQRQRQDQGTTVARQSETRAGSASFAARRPISSESPRVPSTSSSTRQSSPEQRPGSIVISGTQAGPAQTTPPAPETSVTSFPRRINPRTGSDLARTPSNQPRRSQSPAEVTDNNRETSQNQNFSARTEPPSPRNTDGVVSERSTRQIRRNNLVIRGSAPNSPTVATAPIPSARQLERVTPTTQPGHTSPYTQVQRATAASLPRSVEGRPRHERPDTSVRAAVPTPAPQELPNRSFAPAVSQSQPTPAFNRSQPASTFNRPQPQPEPTFNAAAMRSQSMAARQEARQEAAMNRAQQQAPQFNSGGAVHHQPRMNTPAPAPMPSAPAQAAPQQSSSQATRHVPAERRGR